MVTVTFGVLKQAGRLLLASEVLTVLPLLVQTEKLRPSFALVGLFLTYIGHPRFLQVPSHRTTDLFSSRQRPNSSSTETDSSRQMSENQGSLLPVSISWLLVALSVCRTEGGICEQNGALTLALQACASWPLQEGNRSIRTGL